MKLIRPDILISLSYEVNILAHMNAKAWKELQETTDKTYSFELKVLHLGINTCMQELLVLKLYM